MLANSRLVCSRQPRSNGDAEYIRSQHIDIECDRLLDGERRVTAPPSPAPADPELELLREVYDCYEEFELTQSGILPYEEPNIDDYLEASRRRTGAIPKRSVQKSGRRRASTPRPTGYRHTHSAYSDIPDVQERPESIEPVTYEERYLGADSPHISFDRFPRTFYAEQPSRVRIYQPRTRTFWAPSPSDSIDSNVTITDDVLRYRHWSAHSYLDLSPEIPDDFQRFQVN